jgi:hypothetical protein
MGSETIFLTAGDGILNSGANVATLTLHKPMGAECVLNSITVAKNSHTVVGALPAVVCNGAASADWYLNSGTKAGSTVGQVQRIFTAISSLRQESAALIIC